MPEFDNYVSELEKSIQWLEYKTKRRIKGFHPEEFELELENDSFLEKDRIIGITSRNLFSEHEINPESEIFFVPKLLKILYNIYCQDIFEIQLRLRSRFPLEIRVLNDDHEISDQKIYCAPQKEKITFEQHRFTRSIYEDLKNLPLIELEKIQTYLPELIREKQVTINEVML